MVKQNKRVFSSPSSSSSSLDTLAEVATQQLMELGDGNGLTVEWVFDEKAVLAEFISFCAKKKRLGMGAQCDREIGIGVGRDWRRKAWVEAMEEVEGCG
ncbi:hypothetical protein Pyn_28889 [Prunus yedoensis var. nudiflora]|uniref:Uncharacterized protein n=1 Tax=Prunus yedoensis var. nudiflora TaxID=2094558 RepID=A0A315AMD7_PRUYE|nr:hypothetical protein Pyn_28889 [Prunus yedoensis var. nudiflora]